MPKSSILSQLESASCCNGLTLPKSKKTNLGGKHPSVQEANERTRLEAIARYRKAMGTSWMRTAAIEQKLSLGKCSALATLQKWAKDELLERRRSGHAWEWKWKN